VTRFSSYPFFIVSIVPIVFFVPLARGPFSGSSNPTTGMCCSLPTGRATAQGTKNTMATMGTMEFLGFNVLVSVFILSIFIVSIVPIVFFVLLIVARSAPIVFFVPLIVARFLFVRIPPPNTALHPAPRQ
jgi:hypothetical protein